MRLVGFETTISAGERPQTYALYRAATGTGHVFVPFVNMCVGPIYEIPNKFQLPVFTVIQSKQDSS